MPGRSFVFFLFQFASGELPPEAKIISVGSQHKKKKNQSLPPRMFSQAFVLGLELSVRSCNGAIKNWSSSDVYFGVMCCEQFQSNASTCRTIARSIRAG